MLSHIDLLKTFIAAAESESFKDAAVKANTTPQSVSRAIKELELKLGEHLFYRTTRMIKITEFGKSILDESRKIVNDVERLFDISERANENDTLKGVVKLSAPIFIGRHNIPEIISNILMDNEALTIELTLNDQVENFVQSEIDIGIRVGSVDNNGYVVRKLTSTGFSVVASPEFIVERGITNATLDYENIPVVLMKDSVFGGYKNWIGEQFQHITFNDVKLISNDQNVICDAICRGIGISQIPTIIAQDYVRSGRMVTLSDSDKSSELDVYLYRPQTGPVPRRVRFVFDEIVHAINKL